MTEETKKPFIKGYRFPIYPTDEQKVLFENTFGCCRYVYNKALGETKADYDDYLKMKEMGYDVRGPDVNGFYFVKKITEYKKIQEFHWLKEVPVAALQQSMLHLGKAFAKFFKTKKGFPVFKKKQTAQSFSLAGPCIRIKEGKLYIPRCEDFVKVVYNRELPSHPTSLTISRTSSGKYFVSFTCEYVPFKTSGTKITGIDLGIKTLATFSDGTMIENPKFYLRDQRKLRRKQQALSRKKKDSKNKHKARIAVALQHERTTNCRTDQLHKLSRSLINENQVIGVENLQVKSMMKMGSLSRHIAGASWGRFLAMLENKVRESQHCNLVYVDKFYASSHICNETGKKLDRKLKLSEREWLCPYCGNTHGRDVNAAKNIADEAMVRLYDAGRQESRGFVLIC